MEGSATREKRQMTLKLWLPLISAQKQRVTVGGAVDEGDEIFQKKKATYPGISVWGRSPPVASGA